MKISTHRQYHSALAQIEQFIEKGFSHLTAQQTEKLRVISLAVEAYEKIRFTMPVTATIPALLKEYMHENKLNKTALSKLLEIKPNKEFIFTRKFDPTNVIM